MAFKALSRPIQGTRKKTWSLENPYCENFPIKIESFKKK
jgi:hypothetical protein